MCWRLRYVCASLLQMDKIDSDSSGQLDFDEFLAWWQTQDPEAQRQLMMLQDVNFDDL